MITNVSREKLLEILQDNQAKHHETFEKALEAYREQAVVELNGFIDRIKAGRVFRVISRLPVPEDHTSDYAAIIGLLELSDDVTVELSDHDVRRYVQDKWEWEASFAANTLRYTEPRNAEED